MTDIEAIQIRQSRRSYLIKEIEKDKLNKLNTIIREINKSEGLHFQMVLDNSETFSSMNKVYGFFKNVRNCIILCGKKSNNLYERLGYYGEKIVLEATKLGLGTCWVGGTFDKKAIMKWIGEDEVLYGVITFGYAMEKLSFKEKVISKAVHRNTKSAESMYETVDVVPAWFMEGMKAVQKAPSAVNGQPVMFKYKNGIITAEVPGIKEFQFVDLGIAMLHFEIGCGGGSWEIINKGNFSKV